VKLTLYKFLRCAMQCRKCLQFFAILLNEPIHVIGPSWQLMIIKISIILRRNYDENSGRGLLGCEVVHRCGRIPTFRRSILPQSSSPRRPKLISSSKWKPQISYYVYIKLHQNQFKMQTMNLTHEKQRYEVTDRT